jgi:hypothetical protein
MPTPAQGGERFTSATPTDGHNAPAPAQNGEATQQAVTTSVTYQPMNLRVLKLFAKAWEKNATSKKGKDLTNGDIELFWECSSYARLLLQSDDGNETQPKIRLVHPQPQNISERATPKAAKPFAVTMLTELLTYLKLCRLQDVVKKYNSDAFIKKFDTYSHVVTMVYSQIAGLTSLRQIVEGMEADPGTFHHLHVKIPPKSTLAHANQTRSADVFEELALNVYRYISSMLKQQKQHLGNSTKKFTFLNDLYLVDSTLIELCKSVYNWADYKTTTSGVKIHTVIKEDTKLPYWALVSVANLNDANAAEKYLQLPKGSIICADRGYLDYGLLAKFASSDVYFVTRLKSTSKYEVIRDFEIPKKVGRPRHEADAKELEGEGEGVIRDSIIKLTGKAGLRQYVDKLRAVEANVWLDKRSDSPEINDEPINEDGRRNDASNAVNVGLSKDGSPKRSLKRMIFLTNNFSFSPRTIAAIYKSRWGIESFFKDFKSNFNIEDYNGASENAVIVQTWASLIAYMLMRFIHYTYSDFSGFLTMIRIFRMNMCKTMSIRNFFDKFERRHNKEGKETNDYKRKNRLFND